MNLQSGEIEGVPRKRLWFGFAAAAAAWAVHGLGSFLISWSACRAGSDSGFAAEAGEVRGLLLGLTAVLLAVVILAWTVSFRNWRQVFAARQQQVPPLTESEGRQRDEFLALGGILISTVFVVGIFWGTVPLFLLDVCVTAK